MLRNLGLVGVLAATAAVSGCVGYRGSYAEPGGGGAPVIALFWAVLLAGAAAVTVFVTGRPRAFGRMAVTALLFAGATLAWASVLGPFALAPFAGALLVALGFAAALAERPCPA
jgi:hypothetical protein